MTRILRSLALIALLLGLAQSAHATSCWATPHTWSSETITDALLNGTRDLLTCLKTEINNDGSITRDVVVFTSGSAIGNTGASPTLVNTYSMPAGKLATDGDSLEITSRFVCAANANTKTVDFLLGAQAIQASSSACNGSILIVRLTVFRYSATTQAVDLTTSGNGLGSQVNGSDAFTQTLANALSVGFRLTATSNNDIVQSWVRIVHSRHP